MTVQMWVFKSALWQDLLVQRGLEVEKVTVLDAPEATNHASYRLFEVRRPDQLRPRTWELPRELAEGTGLIADPADDDGEGVGT
ncbi:hypothetical protein [Streptomyces sp. NPDC091215]|uniref:hypothetical protein n=1 Tax=Streptomyces sp. NPDC091215 TaxID=3155192 RepID=UPI003425A2B5